MTWTHISISCNCWRISRPGQLVTLTLGFPTVGNKLISLGAPLWEFPFLPIHSPCTSRSAHNTSPREPTCRGALNQLIGWCSDDLLSAHGLPYIAGRQLARHR